MLIDEALLTEIGDFLKVMDPNDRASYTYTTDSHT